MEEKTGNLEAIRIFQSGTPRLVPGMSCLTGIRDAEDEWKAKSFPSLEEQSEQRPSRLRLRMTNLAQRPKTEKEVVQCGGEISVIKK
jgi:hypothetical protein